MTKDVSELLNPISDTAPSGDYIRYTDSYRAIQETRTKAIKGNDADYKKLEKLCQEVLIQQSKDLHVVALLIEAWLHLYGVSGLSDGAELVIGLCENYWETLHPQVTEDHDARVKIFEWMDDRLSDAILSTKITEVRADGESFYSLSHLIDARQLELTLQRAGLRRNHILELAQKDGRPMVVDITKAVHLSSMSFYETLLSDVQRCSQYVKRLDALLDSKLREEAIVFRGFDERLSQIAKLAQGALEQKRNLPVTREPVQVAEDFEAEAPEPEKDIEEMSVSELYDILRKVADRIEELEPKSPAPKLIRKAIHWGGLGATELLSELVEHNLSLSEVNKILS